jgi:hypothetical protein
VTDKPEDKTLTEDERDVQRRFQETLGRLVNTPHKKHEPIGAKPVKRASPKTPTQSDEKPS